MSERIKWTRERRKKYKLEIVRETKSLFAHSWSFSGVRESETKRREIVVV